MGLVEINPEEAGPRFRQLTELIPELVQQVLNQHAGKPSDISDQDRALDVCAHAAMRGALAMAIMVTTSGPHIARELVEEYLGMAERSPQGLPPKLLKQLQAAL